jgi:hypothetical protein
MQVAQFTVEPTSHIHFEPFCQSPKFIPQFARKPFAELVKEFADVREFSLPFVSLNGKKFLQLLTGNVQAAKFKVFKLWDEPNGSFASVDFPFHPVNYPLQHPHVLAETWPQKVPIFVLAEPIDEEDFRWVRYPLPHFKPVPKVVSHVVATKWQHRHWISPQDTDLVDRSRGRFGSHACPTKNTVLPTETLIDEWDRR